MTRSEASKKLADCLKRDIEAHERRAQMARAKRDAVDAVRGADGVWCIVFA